MRQTVLALLTVSALTWVATAEASWVADGKAVTAQSTNGALLPRVAYDGNFGIMVVWSAGNSTDDIYAQRIDNRGNLLWGPNGVLVCGAANDQVHPRVVGDGGGGAFISWEDYRGDNDNADPYIQYIHANGNALWTADGVPIDITNDIEEYEPELLYLGAGSVLVAWITDPLQTSSFDVKIQKYNSSGSPQWGAGVTVSAALNDQGNVDMISDGEGGAILAWQDYRNGTDYDVYAQRVNFLGTAVWTVNGVPIATGASGQEVPRLATDGASGAIIAYRNGPLFDTDIYAQRVGPAGTLVWGSPAILCNATREQTAQALVADGLGGAIVTWMDDRSGDKDIRAIRVNSAGLMPGWFPTGNLITPTNADDMVPSIAADGEGGAIIAWSTGASSSSNLYAQRVTNSGADQWVAGGVPVSVAANAQYRPDLVVDHCGDVLMAWRDTRGFGVYAQRLENVYGTWGNPEPIVTDVLDTQNDNGGSAEVTWEASTGDNLLAPAISYYSIYRSTLSTGPWTWMSDVVASGQATYTSAAATTADLTTNWFRLDSHSLDSTMTYESKALDGQSANDLDPDAPQSVNAIWTGNYVYLTITPPGVMPPDFSYYNVYRSGAAGAGASAAPVLIGTTTTEQYTDDTVEPDMGHCYHTTTVDDAGNESEDSETECVGVASGIGDTPAFTRLEVLPNMPNPFSRGTTLRFGLPNDASVRVDVFDVAGRRVISRDAGHLAAGLQSVRLSGRSDRGEMLPSGVYFYKVIAGSVSMTRKMVVQR